MAQKYATAGETPEAGLANTALSLERREQNCLHSWEKQTNKDSSDIHVFPRKKPSRGKYPTHTLPVQPCTCSGLCSLKATPPYFVQAKRTFPGSRAVTRRPTDLAHNAQPWDIQRQCQVGISASLHAQEVLPN